MCVCHHASCYIGRMTNLNPIFMRMTTCTCAGPTSASMKLHLLSHVVPCVRNWGPVRGYSCFQFESQNHSIKKLFHGSKNTSSTVSQIRTCTCIFLALSLGPLLTWLHAGTKSNHMQLHRANVHSCGYSMVYLFTRE